MASSLRAAAARPSLNFSPTNPKFPSVRKLHITGSNAQPSTFLTFQNKVNELKKTERSAKPTSRPFNTTRALQKPNDSSPMDMAYLPSLPEDAAASQIRLIPLLPDTTMSSRASHPLLMSSESVIKPEISTTSAVGEGIISALGESEGGASANSIGLVGIVEEKVKSEAKGARRVWDGFVDDLLGPKHMA